MNNVADTTSQNSASTVLDDFAALKARQQTAWSAGDYAVVGTTLQIVGEQLCEALDIRAGQAVLDVAAGNGNASLAAARRWCDVIATDYVPALLLRARERAAAERLDIEFREADAETLPFPDSFDVVMSTFGAMFTPDQPRRRRNGSRLQARWEDRARELDARRFHRSAVQNRRETRAAAARREVARTLGQRARIDEMFGAGANSIQTVQRSFTFRYRSPAHWLDVFKRYYGPVLKAFAVLDPVAQTSPAARVARADRSVQSCRRRHDGRTERLSGDRHHSALTKSRNRHCWSTGEMDCEQR